MDNTDWILYNQTNFYQNIWFFGTNTTNLTATDQLFLSNPQINLWRFEVIYQFLSKTSLSALNFLINPPASNGSCSIDLHNGTTSSLFTISCSNWFDNDGIKDYSLYSWTSEISTKTIIAYSSISTFQVRLRAGDNQTSLLYLIISIRDQLDGITEYNLSSVIVRPDLQELNNFINDIEHLSNTNSIVQLLASENQNIVGQIITSFSQQLNQMNNQNINQAVSNGISATSISISPLGSQTFPWTTTSINISVLNQYNMELNTHANVREYLMESLENLPITTLNSIQLQSSLLSQLTQSTNQLTRITLNIASKKCSQLSLALYSISTKISYEDVQTATTQLIQCAANILSSVNGPLQKRINILNNDFSRANALPDDYDTNLESDWSNLNLFADGNDFSWETIENNRNIYYQKQLANQIMNEMNELISFLTLSLNIHLNLDQNFMINTSQIFLSLEKGSLNNNNSIVSIRSMIELLAPFGNSKLNSNTNLSRSISLTIFDRNENEIALTTNPSQSIEIIIPRDSNLIIPSMILQNVTSSLNSTPHNQLFHFSYVNITSILPISVHLEIHPLNSNLAYLFIYKFDQLPQLNSSINQINGWKIFCPWNLTNESIYTYFLDNQQTSGHQSLIFGLRELNSTEIIDFCSNTLIINPPITNQRYNFTSNYALRIYTSGCYYLDENNQWKSDGLIVGPLTNHYQTQCFSSH